jgi:plasmid stabilization system protein ParE
VHSRRLYVTRAGRTSLAHCGAYIAVRTSKDFAKRYIASLKADFATRADNGLTGVARGDIKPLLRAFYHDNFVALFYVTDSELRVVKITRGGRDLSGLAYEPPPADAKRATAKARK